MKIFMNTPLSHVTMLSDKRAFSAGEQVMSPVMDKTNKKQKQTIKTAFCFDVELANASETKRVKSQIISRTEPIGVCASARLSDHLCPGVRTWKAVIQHEAISTVSSQHGWPRLREQCHGRKVGLLGSAQPFPKSKSYYLLIN